MARKRILERFAVDNLTAYLVIGTAAFSGFAIYSGGDFGLISAERIFVRGEVWHLLLYPFRINPQAFFGSEVLGLALYCFILWSFGRQLEFDLGAARYTAFVAAGMVLLIAGALFVPQVRTTAAYLDAAIIVAVAFRNPEQQILFWFLIPIRMKWIGYLIVGAIVAMAVLQAIATVSAWPLLLPAVVFGNVIGLFALERRASTGRGASSESIARMLRQAAPAAPAKARHRCTICGVTELSDPTMDFRFCVDCEDHEYCVRHLHEHEHIRGAASPHSK